MSPGEGRHTVARWWSSGRSGTSGTGIKTKSNPGEGWHNACFFTSSCFSPRLCLRRLNRMLLSMSNPLILIPALCHPSPGFPYIFHLFPEVPPLFGAARSGYHMSPLAGLRARLAALAGNFSINVNLERSEPAKKRPEVHAACSLRPDGGMLNVWPEVIFPWRL